MTLPIIPLHEETTPRWLKDSPAVRAVPTLDDLRAAVSDCVLAFDQVWAARKSGINLREANRHYEECKQVLLEIQDRRLAAALEGIENA